jgi:hypothetical protein
MGALDAVLWAADATRTEASIKLTGQLRKHLLDLKVASSCRFALALSHSRALGTRQAARYYIIVATKTTTPPALTCIYGSELLGVVACH